MSAATLGMFTTKGNVRVQMLQGTNCLRIQSKEKKKMDTAWSFGMSEASSNYIKVTHHNHAYYVTVISPNKAHHV
jgi:hypothetical protein